jgi:hypothetical protein
MAILGSRVWEGYPSNLALTTLPCEIPCMNQLNNTGEAGSAKRLMEFRPDGATGTRTVITAKIWDLQR